MRFPIPCSDLVLHSLKIPVTFGSALCHLLSAYHFIELFQLSFPSSVCLCACSLTVLTADCSIVVSVKQ